MDVLFRDEFLCVINKPSGHVVHKTRGAGDSPVILQELRDQLGQHIYPVHRLDRGTSGCLAFAFSSQVASGLQESLSEGEKYYTALCFGELPFEGRFDRELTSENGQKQKALTQFQKVEEFHIPSESGGPSIYTLLGLKILTGRKHQIRRHLSHEGHHIVGDVNHGKGWLNRRFRENYDFHRLFLHCHELSFVHPVTQKPLSLKCPLPEELTNLLKKLI